MRAWRGWCRPAAIGLVTGLMTLVFLTSALRGSASGVDATPLPACPLNTVTTSPTTTSSSTSSTSSTSSSTTSTTINKGPGLGGTAGTSLSLPLTPSACAASGHGPFAGLTVTVNQTKDLVHQAVLVSWTGGAPSAVDPTGLIEDNFVQIMQCWGDDGTGTGPPPEQCEFGALVPKISTNPTSAGPNVAAYPLTQVTHAVTRVLATQGDKCAAAAYAGCQSYDQLALSSVATPSKAYVDNSQGGDVLDPFQPVSGDRVPVTTDTHCCLQTPPWTASWDQNPWFNHATTNEVDVARTYPDHTGQNLFQVDTANEAGGLGCGQAQPKPDGTVGDPPKCWLVVVPRGSPVNENTAGTDGPPSPSNPVNTSPLSPGVWSNRIAIPIDFQPVGTGCAAGATVRRFLGGEPAQAAVHSWQPALCQAQTSSAYLFTGVSEDTVRSNVVNPAPDVVGGVVTFPVPPATVNATNPLVYAPLTLSGVAIGLNLQRVPQPAASLYPQSPGFLPPDEIDLVGRPVTHINLTPRLVAKLLTESYLGAFGPFPPTSITSTWAKHNADYLFADPEFQKYNPEFAELMSTYTVDSAQLVVSQPLSDAATLVWQWIVADPAAKAWLGGAPDDSGMQVNPNYATDPSYFPSEKATPQAVFKPPVNTYPKNDPYCFTPAPNDPQYQLGTDPPQEARPLCQQDWAPYSTSMSGTAASVSAANSGSHTTFNPVALTANSAWSADGTQAFEHHAILGVTTTDQAARYGLTVAALSQAGDDGGSPTFIAPDNAGLTSAEGAMKAGAVPSVLEPDPATRTAGAYPLSLLTYAAVAPLTLDKPARTAASAFLTYAAGNGQTAGYALGSLPPGYAPLPSALTTQTTQAAATVTDPSSLVPPTTTTPPSPTTTTAPATTVAPATTTTAPQTTATLPTTTTTAVPKVTPAPSPVVPFRTPTTLRRSTPPVTSPVFTAPTTTPKTTVLAVPGRTAKSSPNGARYAVLVALIIGTGSALSSRLLLHPNPDTRRTLKDRST